MNSGPDFKEAVHEYAVRANQRYGTVPDSVFEDAFALVNEQFASDIGQETLSNIFRTLDETAPGTFDSVPVQKVGDGEGIYWKLQMQTKEQLEDGIEVGVDSFALISLARLAKDEPDFEALDVYRARGILRGTGEQPESIMGIERKKTGTNFINRHYAYPGLREKLAEYIISQPDQLIVTIGAKAHLPEAPAEVLPVGVDLSFAKVRKATNLFSADRKGCVEGARRHLQKAQVPANDHTITELYQHMFGYEHVEGHWTMQVPQEHFRICNLRIFREQSQQVPTLLRAIYANNPLQCQDMPSVVTEAHWRKVRE